MHRTNAGFALLVVSAVLLAGVSLPSRPGAAQVAGQNVNMVSGTQWPYGDPFKQRQNEPSLAVSTRNPLHLLAGANDYRSVDIAFADPDNGGEQNGDAWLGVFKSFDGGQTWQSTLLPGYPQDTSAVGLASPLHGWSTAADPIVRAANNGLFYYAGIAFNRGTNNGVAFVTRFIDLANKENGAISQGTDPIRYLGTTVIETGNSGQFLDKPWIAVDIPRGTATCNLAVPAPGGGTVNQTIPAGKLYAAYSVFLGSGNNPHSKIYLKSSSDCGATWTNGTKLNDDTHVNQGTTIGVDPATGTIFVAWRVFGKKNEPDTIQLTRSTNGGNSFDAPVVVQSLPRFDPANPAGPAFFDQGMTGTSIRTNALPSIAVDGNGRVYVAWSQRGVGPSGDARVVMKTSADGRNWSGPLVAVDGGTVIDDAVPAGQFTRGHQVMPAMTLAGGKLMLVYYDLRWDHTAGIFLPNEPFKDANGKFYFELRAKKGELLDLQDARVFTPYIDDYGLTERRHTVDVRVAQADPAATPAFSAAWASQYRFGTRGGPGDLELDQLQVNPPNLPMFVKGTAPFLGDYIDVAGLTMRPDGPNGAWRFTTAPEKAPVHYAVWTSNQDVRPPVDGNWAHYTPPASTGGTSLFDPTQQRPACVSGNEGTRDQNIYMSRITQGLLVAAPQSVKQLSTTLQRAFVVTLQNATKQARTFRLTIASQPAGGFASFTPAINPQTPGTAVPIPVPLTTQVDVTVGGNAGAARNVYATSSVPTHAITVNVVEFDQAGTSGNPVPNGLTSSVTLNADGTVPSIVDPDGKPAGSSIQTVEIYSPNVTNPNVTNPNVTNPNVTNPNVTNPNVTNPNVTNPNVTNPNVTNPDIANPNVTNPNVTNPNVTNPNVTNPNVTNPNVTNPNVTNTSVSDATYTITNSGNTTSTYTVKLVKTGNVDPDANLQLLVNKTYAVPVAYQCVLFEQTQTTLLANVPNPVFVDIASLPNSTATDPSLTNPTFALGPGETALVTLRGSVPIAAMTDIVTKVAPVGVPHAPNTNSPTNTPTIAAPLFVTTSSLPDGVVGQAYPSVTLAAIGGKPGYSWTAPPPPAGLTVSPAGVLSGAPAGPSGTATIQLTVTDAAATSASRSLPIRIADLLVITTAALPNGLPGVPYAQTLVATGGLGAQSWSVIAGSLPPGLSLSPGSITGTPTATGTWSFSVQVVDSATPAQTATRALSITIDSTCGASALAASISAASGTTQTINLLGSCTYSFVSGSAGDPLTALPHITAGTNLTVNGNGAIIERSATAGTPAFRIVAVDAGATLTLNNLTVRNGGCAMAPSCSMEAGGALVYGTLNVSGSTFSGNSVTGDLYNSRGGAIETFFGTVTVDRSTFSGNSAQNNGGAIFNWGGTLNVTNSTFASNHAGNAGGALVAFSPKSSTITNSTFVGNTADLVPWSQTAGIVNSGSAIYNQSYAGWGQGSPSGPLTVTSSTFSANGSSGSLATEASIPVLISNSILSGGSGANCAGLTYLADGGYNISSDGSCSFLVEGSSLSNTNPLLDPTGLSSAGGPTQVVVPLPGSPAVDAIPPGANGCGTSLTTDQRGATRPTGAGCDIGAIEFPPVIWGWATLSNIRLNGGSNVLTLPGGGAFNLSYDYTIANPPDYCPGCIDQIEIGLAVSPPICTYNGIPYPPQSGTTPATLTAPSTPGVYYIGMDWSLDWGCFQPVTPGVSVPPYWHNGPPGPNRYIGKVIVPVVIP